MKINTNTHISVSPLAVQQSAKEKWIAENLKIGERYAGILLGENGEPDHHLILLPGDVDNMTWPQAMDWATSRGGYLPTLREQALLFANWKGGFKRLAYWSSELHAAYADRAWYQVFSGGTQGNLVKSANLHARAVRRVKIP